MSEGVIEVARDGRIVYVNPAVTTLLEVPETRLLGALFIALFTGADRELVLAHLKEENPAAQKIGIVTLRGHRVALTLLNLVQGGERSRVLILNKATQ